MASISPQHFMVWTVSTVLTLCPSPKIMKHHPKNTRMSNCFSNFFQTLVQNNKTNDIFPTCVSQGFSQGFSPRFPMFSQASTGARGLRPALGPGVLVQAKATLRAGTAHCKCRLFWLGKSSENHGKTWENHRKSWEIEVKHY